jgi:uncharacterized protein (TIGR03067 family)
MKTLAVLAALAMVLTCKLATVHAGEDGDQGKFQGVWSVAKGEKAGHDAHGGDLQGLTMTFTGDKFTWKKGDHEVEGTFCLDPSKKLKEISIVAHGNTMPGIYKLEGDDLKICVAMGEDRPTDFTTKAGTKTMLIVLKRSKN